MMPHGSGISLQLTEPACVPSGHKCGIDTKSTRSIRIISGISAAMPPSTTCSVSEYHACYLVAKNFTQHKSVEVRKVATREDSATSLNGSQ